MGIIIQTGHPSSCSEKLIHALYEQGLSSPKQSCTYGLSAHEISSKIAQILSKGNSPVYTKIVDGLIVDLLLANINRDDWGWADSSNLDALQCWRETDEKVKFILVFDSPRLLLKDLLRKNITIELMDAAIQEWLNYHHQLLLFFENNSECCLLIEGSLALSNLSYVKDYIQTIVVDPKFQRHRKSRVVIQTTDSQSNPVLDVILNEVWRRHPECWSMYERLIKKSSIYSKCHDVSIKSNPLNLIQALNLLSEWEVHQQSLLANNISLNSQLTTLQNKQQAIEQENRLLISQLQQIQVKLENCYQNQHLGASEQVGYQPVYYGAAKRVKEDLPYRLGATMIKHSKSVKGLVVLPVALAKEYAQFRKSQSANLPAIEEYKDVHEAEKVKRHLSYRLGVILVDGIKSKKVLGLPIKLGREVVGFKK